MALLPTKAFEGTGSWSAGGYCIATGCVTSVEALGAEKEKDIEFCFEKGPAQETVQIYYRAYRDRTTGIVSFCNGWLNSARRRTATRMPEPFARRFLAYGRSP